MSTLSNILHANKNARKVDQLEKTNKQLTIITASASGASGLSLIVGGFMIRRSNKKLKKQLEESEALNKRVESLEITKAEVNELKAQIAQLTANGNQGQNNNNNQGGDQGNQGQNNNNNQGGDQGNQGQ